MSYLYGSSPTAYPPPAGGATMNYGAPPPAANAYPHSPYAASAAAPHSPYIAAGQPQAVAYPHSPYAGAAGSTLAPMTPGAYPAQAAQPSPMVGQTYLPSSGQLTYGVGAATPATPAQQVQPFTSNVQPGSVTYTTTTDALGRVTYHHFRAEPATYKSPQGVTYTGIQWVPTETSSTPPIGVAPAGPDVIASFRGQIPMASNTNAQVSAAVGSPPLGRDYRDDGLKSTREWEKEEKRRRKEEKRRNAAWEAERIAREKAEDKEMRKARERDAGLDRGSRMRHPSFGGGLGAGLGAGTYDRERSRERAEPIRERELRDREERELERRMGELDVGGRGGYSADYGPDYGAPPAGTRSRRQSVSARAPGGGIYDVPGYDRDSDEHPSYQDRDATRRRSSIYAAPDRARDAYGASERSRPNSIYGAPERERAGRSSSVYAPRDRSPYRRDASPLPATLGPGGVEVYPPGHIYAGQPVPGSGSGLAASRHHSPIPGAAPYHGGGLGSGYGHSHSASGLGGASPRIGGGMGSSLSPRIGAGTIPGVSPRLGGGASLAGAGGYGAPPPDQLLAAPESFTRPINRAQTFTLFKDLRVQDLDEVLNNIIRPMPAVLGTHDVQPEDWGRLMNDITLAWQGRLPLPADRPTKRSDLVIDLLDLWNSAFFILRCVELVLYKGRNCKSGRDAGLPESRLSPEQLFAPAELTDSEDESEEESEEEYADQYGGYGRHGHGQRHELARAARRKQRLEAKVQREMELNKRYSLWLKYVDPREI